jgi:hypothetical protein
MSSEDDVGDTKQASREDTCSTHLGRVDVEDVWFLVPESLDDKKETRGITEQVHVSAEARDRDDPNIFCLKFGD